jgi:pimeloyl-ACP methyl ester carboxylesterase
MPEAGHMLHWTAPAELSRHLIEFLASDPRGETSGA